MPHTYKNQLMVSIVVITYNHEAFISQTIESILSQKTDFLIEIVIGEDCSTDKTRKICLGYQQKYPEIIRVLPRDRNLGMMPNFTEALESCNGRYIALCDGDDYWTHPLKLQKQVDFLEANPDFAICFHRVKVIFEDGKKEPYLSNQNQKNISNFEDLAEGNFIHTLSCVFRANLFGEFPKWFRNAVIGDYPLHLLNAQYGKIKFFEDTMGVYRINDSSYWGHLNYREVIPRSAMVIEQCYKHFYPKGRKQFEQVLARMYQNLAFYEFEGGNYKLFRAYYKKLFRFMRGVSARSFLALTLRGALSYLPPFANWYKRHV